MVTSTINALESDDKLEAITFERVKEATKKDDELTTLAEAIENTPYEEKLPEAVEKYEKYRQDLHIPGVNILHYSQITHLGKVSNFLEIREEFPYFSVRVLFCHEIAKLPVIYTEDVYS